MRGLVDTDGSIFLHRYQVNGKWYEYVKLSFDNRSPMLLTGVARILKRAGLSPRIEPGQKVMLDRQRDVQWYMDNIGSANPVKLRASVSRRVVPNGKATAC
ncbi:LAGLIDADG family homing endonuclease [Candidatus Uhrbacteria bacterium]|nr:LAGLIDADG family homing endonuclease [Candidatus Uhrbacteria bacterium]